MTRFDKRQTIDHLAEAGPLNPDLVEAIAEAVAASHLKAPVVPAEPWIGSIPRFIEAYIAAFREAACFPASEIDDLRQASLSGRHSDAQANLLRSAVVDFELARRAIHPSAPVLVAIGGLSGTGKSTLAPSVMPHPGAVVLRSDVLRKRLFNVGETDRLPESAYRPEITAQIYEILVESAVRIVAQGHSVVVDAVFAHETERNAIREAARRLNVRFAGLFLETDLATRLSRVGRRQRDASDATPDIAGLQESYNIGALDWTVIDASGTPEQTLGQCERRIVYCEAA